MDCIKFVKEIMELIDISVAKELENIDRRTLSYNRIYKCNNPSPYQWPRKYGKKVKDSVKNKNWELRRYQPEVIND